ncbi:MAG: hypothetical protein WKI04_02555 [Ferruginibacter sp.]
MKTGSVYDIANRGKRKLSGEIIAIIDKCLLDNEGKRLHDRMKLRHKKIDIHEQILSAGYSISYTIFCDYIRTKVLQSKEAFIRQGYGEGSCCEFDWAEVKIKLDGQYRRYYLAVFTVLSAITVMHCFFNARIV